MPASRTPCTPAKGIGMALPPPSMPSCPKPFVDHKEGRLDYLCELTELEFELSLTDLVLIPPAEANGDAAMIKRTESERVLSRVSVSKEERRWSCSQRPRGSTGVNGVMLNMYMPATLTGSIAPTRSGRAGLAKHSKVCFEEDELSHKGASSMGCLKLFRIGVRSEARETEKAWVGVRNKIIEKLGRKHLII